MYYHLCVITLVLLCFFYCILVFFDLSVVYVLSFMCYYWCIVIACNYNGGV